MEAMKRTNKPKDLTPLSAKDVLRHVAGGTQNGMAAVVLTVNQIRAIFQAGVEDGRKQP